MVVKTKIVQVARGRMHGRLWPIVQTGLAAVGAWYAAVLLGVDSRPGFASIAAVISLGAAFGERRQRAVQLICGVMLGIVLADLLVRAIGYGLPQIGVLVVLAMLTAVLLGGSELLVTEAAVSAILVATLSSTPEVRLLEVLIGGGVALVVHTLVFPPDPRIGASRAASVAFGELGAVLRDGAAALAAVDMREAESASHRAESLQLRVGELRHAVLIGTDTARWAPMRRATRAELDRHARAVVHLELAARGARSLARNIRIYARSGRPAQAELAAAMGELALAAWELPAQFNEPWRSGDVVQMALRGAGHATAAAAGHPELTVNEIAGQVRSIAIDIVKASEATETAQSALIEAPTEELLAAVPLPATL